MPANAGKYLQKMVTEYTIAYYKSIKSLSLSFKEIAGINIVQAVTPIAPWPSYLPPLYYSSISCERRKWIHYFHG